MPMTWFSTAGTLAGLQRKADILSVFTVLFEMELSPAKLRIAVFGPSHPDLGTSPELVTHGTNWTPTRVPLRNSGPIKMLGVTFDTTGPQRTQKAATQLRLARASLRCAHRDVSTVRSSRPRSARSSEHPTPRNLRPGRRKTSPTLMSHSANSSVVSQVICAPSPPPCCIFPIAGAALAYRGFHKEMVYRPTGTSPTR